MGTCLINYLTSKNESRKDSVWTKSNMNAAGNEVSASNGRYKHLIRSIMFIIHLFIGIILTVDTTINGIDLFQISAIIWLYIHLFSRILLILINFYPFGILNLPSPWCIFVICLELYGGGCWITGIFRLCLQYDANKDIWLILVFILIFDIAIICISCCHWSHVESENVVETINIQRIEVKSMTSSESLSRDRSEVKTESNNGTDINPESSISTKSVSRFQSQTC